MDASPGICSLTQYGTTNKEIFKCIDGTIDESRLIIVYETVKLRIESLFSGGKSDPLKVFVKQEPHKLDKLRDERYRLIAGVSLIDSIIDRILFKPYFDKVKDTIGHHPIMIGWSPVNDGVNIFHSLMGGYHEKYVCIDKSAWDWTFPSWLFDALLEIIIDTHIEPPSFWIELSRIRFKQLFEEPVWQFKDGLQVKQPVKGVQKSGCYLTILLNSMAQLYLHHLVSIRIKLDFIPFLCLGDDTIQVMDENLIKPYVSELEKLGFKVKINVSDVAEFCGYYLHKTKYLPAYRDKHAFKLRHLTLEEEVLIQTLRCYQVNYAHDHSVLQYLRTIALEMKCPTAIVKNTDLNKYRTVAE